jgi:hypothetical protein
MDIDPAFASRYAVYRKMDPSAPQQTSGKY